MSGFKNVFGGLVDIVVGAFEGVKTILGGIWDIVSGLWDAIFAVFKGAFGIVIGIVRGIVDGIVDFLTWLWDVLVGHSIIPDLINSIIGWFNFMIASFQAVWDAIGAGVYWVW